MRNDIQNVAYTKIQSGELAGIAASTQMPSITCQLVCFKAATSNTGNVYIGASSSVTVEDGATDTTTGIELDAGDSTPWLPVDNLNRFAYICSSTADNVTYLALG